MTGKEAVEHPDHYNQYEGFEVIDVCEQLRAPDGMGGFNRGNAFKYLARAGWKNPEKEVEDLKKAIFCLQREIERLEKASLSDSDSVDFEKVHIEHNGSEQAAFNRLYASAQQQHTRLHETDAFDKAANVFLGIEPYPESQNRHQLLTGLLQNVEQQMSEIRDNNFFVPKLQLCPVCGKRLSWKKFADSNNGVDEFVCDAGHGKCLVTANNPPRWVGIESPFNHIEPSPEFRKQLRSELLEKLRTEKKYCMECSTSENALIALEPYVKLAGQGNKPKKMLVCPQCGKKIDVV